MTAVLGCQGLTARYGGSTALADVTLEVPAGAMVGVVGANGAGKSTLVNALAGWSRGRPAISGEVWLGGAALAGVSAHERARRGLTLVPEGKGIFHELTVEEIRGLVDAFAAAAQRARRMGLDLVELHSAHGYLVHQFLSPLSNKRTDRYGGSLENRMRAPLEVARAVREAWPKERALGARITASDWTAGGFEVQDAVAYARELKAIGLDYVCVSSGGVVGHGGSPSVRARRRGDGIPWRTCT